MAPIAEALIADQGGVILTLDVSAGARQDRFPAGYNEWRRAVICQVRAPPAGGRANKAIISLIASVLDVPKTQIAIISGATATLKKIHIADISPEEVISRLNEALAGNART